MNFLVGLIAFVFSCSAIAAGLGSDPFAKPPTSASASPTSASPVPVKPAPPTTTPAPQQKTIGSPSQIPASPIKPKK